MPEITALNHMVLGRYSEIFLKRGRRRYFLDVLAKNARAAMADLRGAKVEMPYGRLLARGPDLNAMVERLGRVFGLNDLAPIRSVSRVPGEEPEALVARTASVVVELAKSAAARGAETFRISARRTDKKFPIHSGELAPMLGGAVLDAIPKLSVRLRGADLDITVELRPEQVFVGGARTPGATGLPVGSNGRAILLLSGGIDSPVAGWRTLKRGVRIDAVTFDSFPLTGPQVEEKVRALARLLSRWSCGLTLNLVPFAEVQLRYRDSAPAALLMLLYRRSMVRIADQLCTQARAHALVTGESIGQVASQTLANLRAIQAVTRTPILRPLIDHDKVETIRFARALGSYKISIRPHQDCCSLFVPAHPELNADAAHLAVIESRMEDLPEIEARALGRVRRVHFPPFGIGEIRESQPQSPVQGDHGDEKV